MTKADGKAVNIKVEVFGTDTKVKEYKRMCLRGGEDLNALYERWVEEGVIVVNRGLKWKKVKGSLRHQLERIRASTVLISGN